MKTIIFCCLVVASLARPQEPEAQADPGVQAEVLRNEFSWGEEPSVFQFGYELSNGVTEDREGYTGEEEGQSNMRGTFVIPYDDGSVGTYEYVADEKGYRVISANIAKA